MQQKKDGKFIKCDAKAITAFEEAGTLWCTCCDCPVDVRSNKGNWAAHVDRAKHTAAAAKALDKTQSTITVIKGDAAKQLASKRRIALRGAFHAAARTLMPLSTVEMAYSKYMMDAVRLLKSGGVEVGKPSTIRDDQDGTVEAMLDHIREKLRGLPVAVCVDGATVRYVGNMKNVTGVVLCNSVVGDMGIGYFESGTAEEMAERLKPVLERVGITSGQVTGLVADNAAVNGKLAELLGWKHIKCLAHCVALMVSHVTKHFPRWMVLAHQLGVAMGAGGASARSAAVSAAGIPKDKLESYHNRWGSTPTAASTVLKHLRQLRPVVLAWGDDMDDAKMSAGLLEVQLALSDEQVVESALQLAVALELVGDAPNLITILSSESTSTTAVADRLNVMNKVLQRVRDGETEALLASAWAAIPYNRHHAGYESLYAEMEARVVTLARAAAVAGLASYDKHIVPALQTLQVTRMYDNRRTEPLPDLAGKTLKEVGAALGVRNPKMALPEEYALLRTLLPLKAGDQDRKLTAGQFWQKYKERLATLGEYATWYSEFPVSAVTVERLHATMRTFDTALRSAMSDDTMAAEWLFRFNKDILKEMLGRRMEVLERGGRADEDGAGTAGAGGGGTLGA